MKIEVPSRRLARAWQASLFAAADDEARPIIHRSVLIEIYDDHGVRLVSTDSYVLAHIWVPLDKLGDNLEPEVAELPDSSVVVSDADKRGLGLLQYMRKLYRKEEDETAIPPVVLSREIDTPK